MRLFRSAFLAVSSALIWICVADAARPRYGGTLRVETTAAMRSLNPTTPPLDAADAAARRWLHPLIFETLVVADAATGLRPLLATDWESADDATRWRFRLRSGVKLHDGTPLDAGRVAAALRSHNPTWTISADDRVVTIQVTQSLVDLPWQLADSRYAVAFGRAGGEPIGTGPFAIERWEPRRLRLRAHEDHWSGRPFVDAVRIEMGRPFADQLASLDAGRADLVSLQLQDSRRIAQRGMRLTSTAPIELVALVFEGRARTPASRTVRRALSQAIDRESMSTVLLQRHAEPASTIVPEWLGGYAALLRSDQDRGLTKSAVAALAPLQRTITLAVPGGNGLLRTIADRIAVDAREAGFTMTIVTAPGATSPQPDVRLVRIRLQPTTRERVARSALEALGAVRFSPAAGHPMPGPTYEATVQFEQRLIADGVVVPIVHLPELYASRPEVESWREPIVLPTGRWNLADAWLRAEQP
jgi:MarR-like DNA-binding transcriptional regulator SgrR of sgrS sRNA